MMISMRPFVASLVLAGVVLPAPPTATQFAEIASTSGGRVGVFVQLLGAGQTLELNAAERFPMQSVYKLPISMAMLDQVDRKAMTLRQTVTLTAKDMVPGIHSPLRDAHPCGLEISVRDLIRAAIVDSDGTASDALLRLAGGGPRVTAYLRGLGIREMTVVTTEAAMSRDPMVQYKNFSTPKAAVSLLTALESGRALSAPARELLLELMTKSTPGAKRLKGLLPRGTAVAHKTGTDATRSGLTRATNDIGLVTLPDGRRLAIGVFIKDSTADETTRESAIAKIARAAWDSFVR
jgi:beta-lactamase class A